MTVLWLDHCPPRAPILINESRLVLTFWWVVSVVRFRWWLQTSHQQYNINFYSPHAINSVLETYRPCLHTSILILHLNKHWHFEAQIFRELPVWNRPRQTFRICKDKSLSSYLKTICQWTNELRLHHVSWLYFEAIIQQFRVISNQKTYNLQVATIVHSVVSGFSIVSHSHA